MSDDKLVPLEPTDPSTPHDSAKPTAEYELTAVQTVINREFNEPRDGFEPVPFWMILAFSGLLSWGGWYFATYAGDYSSKVLDRPAPKAVGAAGAGKPAVDYETASPADLEKLGARVFTNCVGCHQSTGDGGAGIPPLHKSEWVVGEQNSQARLTRILLYGLNGSIQVLDKSYNGQMPAWGGQLKDEQIAGVLTYIRNNWDVKTGDVIRPSQVKAAREKYPGRPMTGGQSMTMTELLSIPREYSDPAKGGAAPATPPAASAPASSAPPPSDGKDMKK